MYDQNPASARSYSQAFTSSSSLMLLATATPLLPPPRLIRFFFILFFVNAPPLFLLPVSASSVVCEKSFHFRQPSKSIRACMHPHSMTLRSSHTKLTGFVKKSLQPAARASCLSLCRELAVRATIMTGLLNKIKFGNLSSPSGSSVVSGALLDADDEKTPMEFTFSRRLISLVASKPFITGS